MRLNDLFELASHSKPSTHLHLKPCLLDGSVNMASFEELTDADMDRNTTNSSSMLRKPAPYSQFVRGKSTSVPFMPGGMTTVHITDADDADDELLTDIRCVPPGFDRGLVFEAFEGIATQQDVSNLLTGDDELLRQLMDTEEEEEEEYGTQKVIDAVGDNKDIDDLLPDKASNLQESVTKPSVKLRREWAHMVNVNDPFPDFHELVPELAQEYPFELDVFQKRAVYHLECAESVFVAAHTSAGKTVVAEYAIALAQKHMTRAIYTSPIKALSNQKFRDFKNTFHDVGILTGDVQISPEASCLVMTTEILRSMLYRGADLIRDVEFVIFDEVHYVNDAERGVVWEEVIIMLPAHVTLILLSATVPNTKEFADWVGRTKQKDIYVISTSKRPVPLEHHLYAGKDIFKIVDASKTFQTSGYKAAYDALHPKKEDSRSDAGRGTGRGRGASMHDQKRGAGRRGGSSSKPIVSYNSNSKDSGSTKERNTYVHLMGFLKKRSLLPVIVFTFSKRKCEDYANALSNVDLTTGAAEKSEIHIFVERSFSCLKGSDRELPQIMRMRDLLSRGIAVHHGGLLPLVKECVEILFTKGLVKVLFATETFAMGVNAPAKCVVFSMIRKHDGQSFRELLPGEYTQMSGRAGRRGLDDRGVVIIACQEDLPDQSVLHKMILGSPTKLASQFRVTYNMILNLLRVEAIKVEDMIKRSFSENANQKAMPDREQKHVQSSKILESMQKLDCVVCCQDIYEFYDVSAKALTVGYQLHERILKTPVGLKSLSTGRIVIINNLMYRNTVGVIVQPASGSAASIQKSDTATRDITATTYGRHSLTARDDKAYAVLVLTERSPQAGVMTLPLNIVSCPADMKSASSSLEVIPYTSIAVITSIKLNLDGAAISRKDDTEIVKLQSQLLKLAKDMRRSKQIPEHDWSKIRDISFQEGYTEKRLLVSQLGRYQCNNCVDLEQHYSQVHTERMLQMQIDELSHAMSTQNLDFLPEYHQRIQVLKLLSFIDDDSVTIKGRVACEINTADELILTELLLDNFFASYEPAEIVALLSCLVFQEKSQVEPVLTPKLAEGVETIKSVAAKVANIQRECGLDVLEEEAVRSLRLGLVEVVYEWARGLPFKHITDLTDVLEGKLYTQQHFI